MSKKKLFWAESLMAEGGVVPLDMAVGFMADGYDMNRVDGGYHPAEFEITEELLERLS